MLGADGQEKLSRSTVAVVGLGGLGSIVSLYLAAAGVGRLILVDGDMVEEGNLNRQILYDEASIGLPKPFIAARRVRSLNSCVETIPVYERVTRENADRILGEADLVVDALDNWGGRLVLDDYTEQAGKPLVHGAVEKLYGQVMLVAPGGPRLRAIAPGREKEGMIPVIAPAVGVIASLETKLAVEALLGDYSRAGRLYVIDLRLMDIQSIELRS
ncbi:MAG: HesA/MoeB/ThiF family protein [Desulfurococcales archaeon]|nr:HesA/MoeB/ThiF family protein [Desulfurococcales archaeon]